MVSKGKNTMRRSFIITALAAGLLMTPFAAGAQQRVIDGVVGAGTGAIVGGPVGAVVGGAIGYTAGPEITRGARDGYNRGRYGSRERHVQQRRHHRSHAYDGRRRYYR